MADPATSVSLVSQLLEHGVLGLLLAISLFYNWIQHKENKEIQDSHKSDLKQMNDQQKKDAQQVVDRLVQVYDKSVAPMAEMARSLESVEPMVREVRDIILQVRNDRTGRS